MKHYRKMKRRQQARLGSMERKHDRARWRGVVSGRRGGTGEEKGRRQCQLGQKMNKTRGRFRCYKCTLPPLLAEGDGPPS
jgi:hypothetical protein